MRFEGIPNRPVGPRLDDMEKRPGKAETLPVVAWKNLEQGQYLGTRRPIETYLVEQWHPLIDFGLGRGLVWKATHSRELPNGVSHLGRLQGRPVAQCSRMTPEEPACPVPTVMDPGGLKRPKCAREIAVLAPAFEDTIRQTLAHVPIVRVIG